MTTISHVRLSLPSPRDLDRWLTGPIPDWLSVEPGPEPRIAWWATDDAANPGGGLQPRQLPQGASSVPGVVLATVDLDRAASELAGTGWADAGGDPLLGARCLRTQLGGSSLVLAEPNTEGYAAACLARFGEGPIAVALRGIGTGGRAAVRNPVDGGAATYLRLGPRTAPTLILLVAA